MTPRQVSSGERAKMDSPLFTILIDGECPLCRREARFLERLDRGRGRLAIEDFTALDFDAARYGVSREALMERIHGVMPDGALITGVEVFRRAYAAVGAGWMLAPTRWPILRTLSDAAYAWFARHRLRLTGRGGECESGRCRRNV